MKLTLMDAKELSKTLKATVQKSGNLGFAGATAAELHIEQGQYVKFFKDEDVPDSPILVITKVPDTTAFMVFKGGNYYNLHTAGLFDSLGYNYKKDNIICELKREPDADELVGGAAYRLTPRPKKTRKPKEEQ